MGVLMNTLWLSDLSVEKVAFRCRVELDSASAPCLQFFPSYSDR